MIERFYVIERSQTPRINPFSKLFLSPDHLGFISPDQVMEKESLPLGLLFVMVGSDVAIEHSKSSNVQ